MSRQSEHEVRTKAAIVPVLLSIIAAQLTFFGTVFYNAFQRIESKLDAVNEEVITHQGELNNLKGSAEDFKTDLHEAQANISALQKLVGKHEDEYELNKQHP
jgi:hypothetical protein